MPESITIEELRKELKTLRTQFSVFRDAAIAEIARLQYTLQPTISEWPDFPADHKALLEREQAFRQKLGLPMRDRYSGY